MQEQYISLSDLRKVSGIGDKTIERIKEQLLQSELDSNYKSEYNTNIKLDINNIYQGDCLELMNGIPDNSVDLILCDLPYGVTACDWDNQISLDLLWKHYKRIIKMNGVVCLFGSQSFTTDLINSNSKWYKYCWYWIKNQGTNFFHAKRMPIRKVEEIVVFYNKQATYNPQFSEGHEPTSSAKGCSNGEIYHGTNKRNYEGGSTNRYPTNTLDYKCVNNYAKVHPNEKPTDLLEYLIKTYTNEDDIVFDNCMGSGATAISAINTNRNYIGIELDENYYNIAKNRINEHKSNILIK